MTGFSSEWLALREPYDLSARNETIEALFVTRLPENRLVKLLDLASGAGSTVSALKEKVPSPQAWMLVDNDPALLEVASGRFDDLPMGSLETEQLDLSSSLDLLDFASYDAITTSAFLDLVTEPFLSKLIDRITAARKPFLASLSYDGRAGCSPIDPLDERIRQAMNTHQQTDKGFGAALGPFAWSVASDLFRQRGYEVQVGPSDWQADGKSDSFQKALLTGWLEAASEVGEDHKALETWRERRWREVAAGELSVFVGHQDLVAYPK